MYMKKILLIVSLIAFSLPAYANGPDVNFSTTLPPIWCVQVEDLDNVSEQYLLVFDYDQQTGENMGQPWKTVQEGKCYTGGHLLAIPQNLVPEINDLFSDPTKYDAQLDIIANAQDHPLGWTTPECGLGSLVDSEVCTELLDESHWSSKYDSIKINVHFIMGPDFGEYSKYYWGDGTSQGVTHYTDEEEWTPPLLAAYFPDDLPEERIPPAGLNTEISAMEYFKSEELKPRFLSCDQRMRQSTVFHFAPISTSTVNFNELIDHGELFWKMNDSTEVNAKDYLPETQLYMWGQENSTREELDHQYLTFFESIGCLNDVLEVRATVAQLGDPSIDIDTYVANAQEEYKNYEEQVTATSAPEIEPIEPVEEPEQVEEEQNEINNTNTEPEPVENVEPETNIVPDESTEKREEAKERENTSRMIYLIVLPIIGLIGLVIFALVRRKQEPNV